MSRQEDFDKQSDEYVDRRKSFGLNDPYALKEIGEAYYQGCEHGYQYALQHPHWIPVEERSPKEGQKVFAYNGTFKEPYLCFYHDGKFEDYLGELGKGAVSHWMPIVPPRKEEE